MISRGMRNESGFSLVEVMVVSSIMMVLALAIATMMRNQGNAQVAIRERAERTNIESATRGSAANIKAVQQSMLVTDP